MKEFGPQGISRQDKLTVQGQKPYAESIGDTMPEGGEGPQTPQQPEQPAVPNEGESSPFEIIQLGLRKQFEQEHGRPPQSFEENQSISQAAKLFLERGVDNPADIQSYYTQPNEESDMVHPRREAAQPMPRNVSQFPGAEQAKNSQFGEDRVSSGEVIDNGGEWKGPEGHERLKSLEERYLKPTEWDNDEDYLSDEIWGEKTVHRGDTTVRKSEKRKRQKSIEVLPVRGGELSKRERADKKVEEERKEYEEAYEEYVRTRDPSVLEEAGWGERVSFTRSRAFLPEDIRKNLKEDIYGLNINSVEALAAEIMDTDQDTEFQVGGEYQLLDEEGRFQPDNFLHWVRDWMMHWHGEDPEGKWDFGKIVGLKRDYNEINLDSLVQRPGRYFRSGAIKVNEEGEEDKNGEGLVYQELVEQIKRELWLFNASRTFDIDYKAAMGRDEDCAKALNQLFFSNTFTKSVWNQRSALYWMTNMPQNFKEVASAKGEKQEEGRVGEALTTAYLAYYNLSDAEELKRLFGADTALLNKKAILTAIDEQMEEEHVPLRFRDGYISSSDMKPLLEAEGNVLDFVNIFNQPQKSPRIVKVVRALIQEELAKKYNMTYQKYDPKTGEEKEERDIVSVSYADTFALSMARWTGAAARNDTRAVGFDFWSKLQHTEPYREKQFDKRRIGGAGNPYSVHHLKQIGVDLPTGIQSLVGTTPLQIFKQMHESRNTLGETVSEEAKYRMYERISSQLVFADNTMRGFTIDHFNRVFSVYSQLMDSESIDFDKFTHFHVIDGLTFDRGQFEKAVKENFFKPMRYAWSTYRGIDFSKEVRALDSDTQTYRTVHLAEAMFGRQVLDIEPFIKKGKEHIKMTDPNWSEKIDWNKINTDENRMYLWHRAALLRLAAEYWSHRDRHNNDTRYDFRYYEQVMMAIDSLPSGLAGNETDMRSSRSYGSAFTEEEKEWLRKLSKTGKMRLLMGGFGKELATEGLKGLGEAAAALGRGIAA